MKTKIFKLLIKNNIPAPTAYGYLNGNRKPPIHIIAIVEEKYKVKAIDWLDIKSYLHKHSNKQKDKTTTPQQQDNNNIKITQ